MSADSPNTPKSMIAAAVPTIETPRGGFSDGINYS